METIAIIGKFIIRNVVLIMFYAIGEQSANYKVDSFFAAGTVAFILTMSILIYEDIKKK